MAKKTQVVQVEKVVKIYKHPKNQKIVDVGNLSVKIADIETGAEFSIYSGFSFLGANFDPEGYSTMPREREELLDNYLELKGFEVQPSKGGASLSYKLVTGFTALRHFPNTFTRPSGTDRYMRRDKNGQDVFDGEYYVLMAISALAKLYRQNVMLDIVISQPYTLYKKYGEILCDIFNRRKFSIRRHDKVAQKWIEYSIKIGNATIVPEGLGVLHDIMFGVDEAGYAYGISLAQKILDPNIQVQLGDGGGRTFDVVTFRGAIPVKDSYQPHYLGILDSVSELRNIIADKTGDVAPNYDYVAAMLSDKKLQKMYYKGDLIDLTAPIEELAQNYARQATDELKRHGGYNNAYLVAIGGGCVNFAGQAMKNRLDHANVVLVRENNNPYMSHVSGIRKTLLVEAQAK